MYAKKASDVFQQTHNSTCVFAQGKRTKLVYTWNKTTLNENEKPSSASLFLSSTPVKKGGGGVILRQKRIQDEAAAPLTSLSTYDIWVAFSEEARFSWPALLLGEDGEREIRNVGSRYGSDGPRVNKG